MKLYVEKYGPLVIATTIVASAMFFHNIVLSYINTHKLCIDGVYNAVFGWSAIQNGFVFAVYGFVVGSQGTFIEKIRDTTSMNLFLFYTKNATKLSFIVAFYSMVLMVYCPKLSDGLFQYRIIVIWFGLFIWTFLAFARVAYLFGFLVRPRTKPLFPG